MKTNSVAKPRYLLSFLAGLAVSLISSHAGNAAEELPVTFRAALDWFETLQLPSPRNKRFLRLTVRDLTAPQDSGRKVEAIGFVTGEFRGVVSLFTTDLRRIEIPVSADLMPVNPSCELTVISFPDYVRRVIDGEPAYSEAPFCWEMGLEFGSFRKSLSLSKFAQEFVLLAMCLEHQLDVEAKQLAASCAANRLRLVRDGTLLDDLQLSLAATFSDRAVAMLANPANSRSTIAARLNWVNAQFPTYSTRSKHLLAILNQMVDEDARGSRRKAVVSGQETSPALLVHHLRDQRGWDMDDEVFFGYTNTHPGAKSPAERLVELGGEAVPALIAAVGDPRLTRMVAIRSRRTPTVERLQPVTIGECAFHLLTEIFDETPPGDYARSPETSTEVEHTRRQLREYWRRASAGRR